MDGTVEYRRYAFIVRTQKYSVVRGSSLMPAQGNGRLAGRQTDYYGSTTYTLLCLSYRGQGGVLGVWAGTTTGAGWALEA